MFHYSSHAAFTSAHVPVGNIVRYEVWPVFYGDSYIGVSYKTVPFSLLPAYMAADNCRCILRIHPIKGAQTNSAESRAVCMQEWYCLQAKCVL